MCGERLAALVQQTTAQIDSQPDAEGRGRRVTSLTLLGYSLGGLMVRYAAGKLLADGYFERVQPRNLVTVATPHLGSFRCGMQHPHWAHLAAAGPAGGHPQHAGGRRYISCGTRAASSQPQVGGVVQCQGSADTDQILTDPKAP